MEHGHRKRSITKRFREGVVDRGEVARVLGIHSQAYKFLLWLDKQACHDPEVLAPENLTAIRDAETCAVWLDVNRQSFPKELTPADDDVPTFARMLGSFCTASWTSCASVPSLYSQRQCLSFGG